jgi:hypothetical protein
MNLARAHYDAMIAQHHAERAAKRPITIGPYLQGRIDAAFAERWAATQKWHEAVRDDDLTAQAKTSERWRVANRTYNFLIAGTVLDPEVQPQETTMPTEDDKLLAHHRAQQQIADDPGKKGETAPGSTTIHGYQTVTTDKAAIVNANKILEEAVLQQIDMLMAKGFPTVDPRWLAIAKTNIEQGFMAMNRAVFQPQRLGAAK